MGSGDGQRSVDRNDVKPKPDEPQEDDIKVWWRQECNEGAHFYIMGCLEPGSWNAVVLAWSGCVDDAATRLWDAWNLGLGTQWFWLGLVALTMPRRDGDDIPTSWDW
jgi:hypothetical protein